MEIQSLEGRPLSLTGVSAAVLWVAAVVLVLLDVLTEVNTGDMGILLAIGGGTLNVRGYFVDLAHREQNAFELGRDSGPPPDMR